MVRFLINFVLNFKEMRQIVVGFRCTFCKAKFDAKGSSIKDVGHFLGEGDPIADICQLEGARGLRNADV